MNVCDKLKAIVKFYQFEGLQRIHPKLASDVELLYLNEESKFDDEEGISVQDDLDEIVRRHGQLMKILEKYPDNINWIYDQMEQQVQLAATALQ